jgi:hypothetical protein
MHAPPSFQITVCRFGVWRVACAGLATLSFAVTAGWAISATRAHPAWLALSVFFLAAAFLGLLLQAWRLAPTSLRWDGQLWHVGPASTTGQEPRSGRLVVALDLGAWMLLRFVAEGARRGAWLPVQRRGHELAWHGLRATVYCARPVSPPTAAPF